MTGHTISTPPSPPKSTFVTVVAWIFIVLAGFTALISLLQNVMLTFMPKNVFKAPLEQDTTFAHVLPGWSRFMFARLHLLAFAMLAVCIVTLGASIGLLQRRNWARVLFIGLLALGVAYSISGLFLQKSMMTSFNAALPPDSILAGDSAFRAVRGQFTEMMGAMNVVMYVFTLGFAVVFAWIIAKLLSRPIRDEFQSRAPAA